MKYPELELDERIDLQERLWSFERAGWWISFIIIVAGLLGVFGGSGSLSHVMIRTSGGRFEWERFGRVNGQDIMAAWLDPKFSTSQTTDEKGRRLLELGISENFFRYANPVQFNPLPKKVVSENGRVNFYYEPSHEDEKYLVRFYFRYWSAGACPVILSTPSGARTLWKVIYP